MSKENNIAEAISTQLMVSNLKKGNQDFEWYPTTDVMIEVVKGSIDEVDEYRFRRNDREYKVLDVGAGDGRVLDKLGGERYAIEKSSILRGQWSSNINLLGVDFLEVTLMDKPVDYLFCNPPYKEYSKWMEKIIKESFCNNLYFIVPTRWKNNTLILAALKFRRLEVTSLGNYDFFDGDRKARAKIEILHIHPKKYTLGGKSRVLNVSDPFDLWFEENFKIEEVDKAKNKTEELAEKIEQQLTTKIGLIPALIEAYNGELSELQDSYYAISKVNPEILMKLDIEVSTIKDNLKLELKGIKAKYWVYLFNQYSPVTDKLTKKSRNTLLNKITKNSKLEFNLDNILSVTSWAIKNANLYFDQQLIDFVGELASNETVKSYKSNEKVFTQNQTRYNKQWSPADKVDFRATNLAYKLDYRIIINVYEALIDTRHGLSKYATSFINDLLIIASNIGWKSEEAVTDFQWASRKKCEFSCEHGLIVEATAFLNGNIHLRFGQRFLVLLNIQFGKLQGWLHKNTTAEAAKEFDITEDEVRDLLAVSPQLTGKSAVQLMQLD